MEQFTADRVAEIIKEKGFKQCAIAEKAGFTAREFNDILHHRKTFKADYIRSVCKALDITPNELYAFDERK